MFVKSAASFYLVRFLLGSFEAGLYPGVILYLTYWFPARRRAQMLGLFMTAIPAAGILGGPISGWIMASTGHASGLANWQWLFLLEGVPSLLMGIAALATLVDKPGHARWLTAHEKQLVLADLAADHRQAGPARTPSPPRSRSRACGFSPPFTPAWSAPIRRSPSGAGHHPRPGRREQHDDWTAPAVPYLAGAVATVLAGRHSDRTLERRYHCALACLAAAVGLVLIGALAQRLAPAFAALVLAVTGVLSAFAPFWQMPAMFLAGNAAAGGIALINSIGNLSGWAGPFFVGWL